NRSNIAVSLCLHLSVEIRAQQRITFDLQTPLDWIEEERELALTMGVEIRGSLHLARRQNDVEFGEKRPCFFEIEILWMTVFHTASLSLLDGRLLHHPVPKSSTMFP